MTIHDDPQLPPRRPWTGERVRAVREALNRTQEEFARILGTSQVTLCRWERGRHEPSPAFRRILEHFESRYVRPKDEEETDHDYP